MSYFAYRHFVKVSASNGEIDPVHPCAFDSAHDVLIRHIFDPGRFVLLYVTLVEYSLYFVLRLAQPAFFEIMENNFKSILLTGYETCVCDSDIEVSCLDQQLK